MVFSHYVIYFVELLDLEAFCSLVLILSCLWHIDVFIVDDVDGLLLFLVIVILTILLLEFRHILV